MGVRTYNPIQPPAPVCRRFNISYQTAQDLANIFHLRYSSCFNGQAALDHVKGCEGLWLASFFIQHQELNNTEAPGLEGKRDSEIPLCVIQHTTASSHLLAISVLSCLWPQSNMIVNQVYYFSGIIWILPSFTAWGSKLRHAFSLSLSSLLFCIWYMTHCVMYSVTRIPRKLRGRKMFLLC